MYILTLQSYSLSKFVIRKTFFYSYINYCCSFEVLLLGTLYVKTRFKIKINKLNNSCDYSNLI